MPEKVHPEGGMPGSDDLSEAAKCGAGPRVVILSHGDAEKGIGPTLRIRTGHATPPHKEYEVCRYSLCCIPYTWRARRMILAFIEWKWFDRFILLNIATISLLSASYSWRDPPDAGFNWVVKTILERIINAVFIVELLLKVVAWGLICSRGAYLRSAWNWLDFVVVLDAIVSEIPQVSGGGLSFLRLFRALRPLRSLNAVPQMKVLVNTVICSVPKLGNVTMMALFLYLIFAIIGITLYDGIFYRRCRLTEAPVFNSAADCWAWEYASTDRLCGGSFSCPAGTYCGGHEEDQSESLRPKFPGGRQGKDWCAGSGPLKLFPETDFIHFDHLGGAFLIVFQCMTLEGWTDIMYWVQDSYNEFVAAIYFSLMICVTSHFLLNVALAVVDETRDNFDDEEVEDLPDNEDDGPPGDESGETHVDEPVQVWFDCRPVRILHAIATSEIFLNVILLAIIGNVIMMMTESFPPEVSWKDFSDIAEKSFLGIFCVEMVVMLGAVGPIKYFTNFVTALDGIIVIGSIVQQCLGQSSNLTALRVLRLFRVLNKLQDRWHSLRVLLKAIFHTGMALNYWLVLFGLVLYICTLLFQELFSRKFHFQSPDDLDVSIADGRPWCPDKGNLPPTQESWNYWQDCIPRAHFDTFLWAFVTIFQIMTGENWNTVMYAGMRATSWAASLLFGLVIIFGQTLFLSLFLSILTSKFQLVNQQIAKKQAKKEAVLARKRPNTSSLVKPVQMFHQLRKTMSASSLMFKDNSDIEDEKDSSTKRVDVKPKPVTDTMLPGQVERSSFDEKVTEDEERDRVVPLTLGLHRQASEEMPAKTVVSDPPTTERQASVTEIQARRAWPHGYAWFVLSEHNPVRRAARWILEASVMIRGEKVKIFDSAILLCILLSTLCMVVDSPLADPQATLTGIVRVADKVFAVIFMAEMVVKLTALGLVWGPDAYLKSGWNWLDGIVVIVSIIDLASQGSGGFLKTMRILRAFRPLRVISRNENLKVVVQTIFASVPDLATLLVVSSLFLLIFALLMMSLLQGGFYHCPHPAEEGAAMPALARDISNLTTPLCIRDTLPNATFPVGTANDGVARQDGKWNQTTNTWQLEGCPRGMHSWSRATVDTPICIGRCDPLEEAAHLPPTWLCPRRFQATEELPPVGKCRTDRPLTAAELRGVAFVEAMKRALVMPCGGSAVEGNSVNLRAGSSASCREIFCPRETISSDTIASCASNCRKHPDFCSKACEGQQLHGVDAVLTLGCESCLHECEAQCQCKDFCTPLIKDAALCNEQGQAWSASLSQSFDHIWSSLLTLFEISTTEGWVDVMYSAADSTGKYMQPLRDNQQWIWAPLFVLYIFFMTMFLINLSVGIIVDRFIELKTTGSGTMMTEAQQRWIRSKMTLYNRTCFFQLTNLQRLSPLRRNVYNFISHKYFDRFIMAAICLNTLLMSLKMFPSPTDWWSTQVEVMNYIFQAVFLLEAILKIFALRRNYFRDSWNLFDFVCVLAGMISLLVRLVSTVDMVAISQVVRIFRIARLFRIMRSFKEVNKIFMALLLSLPRLVNVMAVLLLVLTLYSILGVSLFATAKKGETLDDHGNFKDFWKAFMTLFRASTGEAWNELMHDLSKDERAYYKDGDWCSPNEWFDYAEKYSVLEGKCLVEEPNACVQNMFGHNILPVIYWVSYILVCLHLMMNLVIAVILDGYEEGRHTPPEEHVIELCKDKWKKYDPFITEKLSLPQAMCFINDAYAEICHRHEHHDDPLMPYAKQNSSGDIDVTVMPMQFANCLDLVLSQDGQVSFTSAARQVLRLAVLSGSQENITAIEGGENLLDNKTATKLRVMENRMAEGGGDDLKLVIAATKLQRQFRAHTAARQRRTLSSESVGDGKNAATGDGARGAPPGGAADSGGDIPKDLSAEGAAGAQAQGDRATKPSKAENLPRPREAG